MLQNRDVHWILVQLSVRLEWLYLTAILFLLYTLYNNLYNICFETFFLRSVFVGTPEEKYYLKINSDTWAMTTDVPSSRGSTPERCQWRRSDVFIVNLMNRFHTLSWCFHCWLGVSKCCLGIVLWKIFEKVCPQVVSCIFHPIPVCEY